MKRKHEEVNYGKGKGREEARKDGSEEASKEGRKKRLLRRPNDSELRMIAALQSIHNETRNEEKASWSR